MLCPYLPEQAEAASAPTSFKNALRQVEEVTGDILKPAEGKNIFAQALSALGASNDGKARAASLSKKKLAEIARKAAAARWKKYSMFNTFLSLRS
jgi:hypothetical protein